MPRELHGWTCTQSLTLPEAPTCCTIVVMALDVAFREHDVLFLGYRETLVLKDKAEEEANLPIVLDNQRHGPLDIPGAH